MNQLLDLYRTLYNTEPATAEPITGSGSQRRYYRLKGQLTVIGTAGTSIEENRAFIALTRHFASKGLPVPHILAVSDDQMAYLQTDLGDTSLYQAVSKGRRSGIYSPEEKALLHKAMAMLPHFQITGVGDLDTTLCYPTPKMDAQSIMFDLNYFKYCYLKLLPDLDFNEITLQRDLDSLCADILSLTENGGHTLILRDFQARNVMLRPDGSLALIDYQGCRLGPAEYDLASFLWQASARYPAELRNQLTDTYIGEASRLRATDGKAVRERLKLMVFFRLLQVLGAYGYRGLHQRKTYFLNSIPAALSNLRDTLAAGVAAPYPYLQEVLKQITEAPPHKGGGSPLEGELEGASGLGKLTVTVCSFSYKRGIPQDPSGNGGGYVFDCRSTHNPGRYEQYKSLTGLDQPVIKFLEDDGEITGFLSHVYPLAEHHVERYMERGFTHLMFCFGCTGGQHRSVYCAQHLAEHLHTRYPEVRVRLIHREQNIEQEL